MTEHERTLLGQLLERPEIYHEATIDSKHFADAEARRIWTAAGRIIGAGDVPDMVSLKDADKSISAATLSTLSAPTTANWQYYEKAIRRGYAERKLKELGAWLSDNAKSDDAAEHVESVLEEVTREATGDKVHDRKDLVHGHIQAIEERYKRKGALPGLSSAFRELDSALLGYRPRRYYIVGGRPGSGKSAMLLNLADYMAMVQELTVGFITLESAKEELMDRTLANIGSIDSNALAAGRFFAKDFKTLTDSAERVYNSSFYLYEVPNARLEQVMSAARQMVRRYGCQILFVDYVQLIRSQGDRREQVERASLAMKELARQLDVPVIVAAQLRRDVDGRRPGLGDFQHSSQMEQDADAAILLHEDEQEGCVWAHIAKNRDGKKGSVKLRFKGEYVRFEEDENG